jgi:protein O-mannosyl-transferase
MKPSIPESRRVLALFVAVVAAAVYLNSLANGFALDDVYIVQLNARAHDPSNLSRIWLTPYWPFLGQELGLYRPMIIFLFAIQWSLGDGAAWVFHAVNIALHSLVAVLVFVLLDRLTARVPAFIGALIFAVHPVHTEAVANIVGQAELVAAAVVLGACLIHAGRPTGFAVSWPRRLALVALLLIGLTTKESTVVLPALLVAVDFAQRRVPLTWRGAAAYADAMLMPVLLLAAALAAYLLLRFEVMAGSVIGVDAAPSMPYIREEYRVLNALRAFPVFFRLLLFPWELSSDYSPAVILPVETVRPMVIFGTSLLTLVVGLALITPWKPTLGFPAAWFLISIITVSNLFFPIGVVVAERTLYLPSVAVSALVAYAWRAAAPRVSASMRVAAPAFAVIVLTLFAYRTWIRNPEWDSTNSIWAATYRDHPHSYRAQWVQASLVNSRGRPDLAEAHYRLGYSIYSRDAQFNADYANFMMSHGNYEDALPLLEAAHEAYPYVANTATMLAYAYVAVGRFEDALDLARRAESHAAGPLFNTMAIRGYAYLGLGDRDNAIGAFRVAAAHAPPGMWRARAYVARALAFGGYPDAAVAQLDSARAMAADSAALDILTRADDALAAGCFSPDSAYAVPPAQGMAYARRPSCDPLGDWYRFTPATQNANVSHNATAIDSLRVGEPAGRTPHVAPRQ